jgi:hypothetical protein
MQASIAAQELSRHRWSRDGSHHRARGRWTGERNPCYALTKQQKKALAKRLTEGRWRRDAAKQAAKLQAQTDELRAVADALWGDWRPRVR